MDTIIKYQFQDCLSSELDSIPIIPGTFIYCVDSKESYYDTIDSKRVRVSKYVVILPKDSDRIEIMAPDTNCLYVVIETKRFWVYNDSEWKDLTRVVYFDILNVNLAASETTTIEHEAITADCSVKFIPIPNLSDIYIDSDIELTCNAGSITAINNSSYEMLGTIKVMLP